ncbi:hypothetical protein RRG08_056887 [Elysia crispata]|uniref:Uncharacterized protein n=1 Tax=Elysia crispata TaxID=231223 RepID=A0AAE0ZC95_9GAST|nr:hypothetical protein RRG08_056887 [Elysia crispata]
MEKLGALCLSRHPPIQKKETSRVLYTQTESKGIREGTAYQDLTSFDRVEPRASDLPVPRRDSSLENRGSHWLIRGRLARRGLENTRSPKLRTARENFLTQFPAISSNQRCLSEAGAARLMVQGGIADRRGEQKIDATRNTPGTPALVLASPQNRRQFTLNIWAKPGHEFNSNRLKVYGD